LPCETGSSRSSAVCGWPLWRSASTSDVRVTLSSTGFDEGLELALSKTVRESDAVALGLVLDWCE